MSTIVQGSEFGSIMSEFADAYQKDSTGASNPGSYSFQRRPNVGRTAVQKIEVASQEATAWGGTTRYLLPMNGRICGLVLKIDVSSVLPTVGKYQRWQTGAAQSMCSRISLATRRGTELEQITPDYAMVSAYLGSTAYLEKQVLVNGAARVSADENTGVVVPYYLTLPFSSLQSPDTNIDLSTTEPLQVIVTLKPQAVFAWADNAVFSPVGMNSMISGKPEMTLLCYYRVESQSQRLIRESQMFKAGQWSFPLLNIFPEQDVTVASGGTAIIPILSKNTLKETWVVFRKTNDSIIANGLVTLTAPVSVEVTSSGQVLWSTTNLEQFLYEESGDLVNTCEAVCIPWSSVIKLTDRTHTTSNWGGMYAAAMSNPSIKVVAPAYAGTVSVFHRYYQTCSVTQNSSGLNSQIAIIDTA